MASPFSTFRRNQRIWMAVVTLMAMISFVFFNSWNLGASRSQRDRGADLVAKSIYGNLTGQEVGAMTYSRRMTHDFVNRLANLAAGNAARKMGGDLQKNPSAVQWLSQTLQLAMNYTFFVPVEYGDEGSVQNFILASKAKELGMTVSDAEIKSHLSQRLGLGVVSDPEIGGLMQNSGGGGRRGMSEDEYFATLRESLLARKLIELYENPRATQLVPPAQQLDYYCRDRREATAAVVGFPVANYVGQVAEPSEKELKELFETRKNTLADPESPEPGFKEPAKVQYSYFKLARGPIESQAAAEVTEEQIAEYYQEHRSNFRRPIQDLVTPTDKPAAESKPESKTEGTDAPKDEPATPADKPTDPQGSSTRPSPFRFAADEKPAEAAPADPAASGTETKEAAADADQFKSLEEVRAAIKQQLTDNRRKQIQTKIEEQVRDVLLDYYNAYTHYQADLTTDPKAVAPPLPDYQAVAKQHGLDFVEMDKPLPHSAFQYTELGKSVLYNNLGQVTKQLSQTAFGKSELPFRPGISKTSEGDVNFIYWKTQQTEERVPKYSDVSTEVADLAKSLKARDLARKDAEEMATKARKEKKLLQDLVVEKPQLSALRIGPVTWLSRGLLARGQSPLSLSEIKEIPLAGWDFMQVLFSLDVAETGVASNHPQTIYYAIQVESLSPPMSDLSEEFARNRLMADSSVASLEARNLQDRFIRNVTKEAKLVWLPKASSTPTQSAPIESVPLDDDY